MLIVDETDTFSHERHNKLSDLPLTFRILPSFFPSPGVFLRDLFSGKLLDDRVRPRVSVSKSRPRESGSGVRVKVRACLKVRVRVRVRLRVRARCASLQIIRPADPGNASPPHFSFSLNLIIGGLLHHLGLGLGSGSGLGLDCPRPTLSHLGGLAYPF